ncbi:MAG: hypothetical protein ABGW85_09880 [Sulfurimonas sp.]
MELKDVILSTLAEMENDTATELEESSSATTQTLHDQEESTLTQERTSQDRTDFQELHKKGSDSELNYLKSIRERLLVLFEGFQAPNNTNIEAKIDMTLNFLEYMLATIDERVEKLEKGESA